MHRAVFFSVGAALVNLTQFSFSLGDIAQYHHDQICYYSPVNNISFRFLHVIHYHRLMTELLIAWIQETVFLLEFCRIVVILLRLYCVAPTNESYLFAYRPEWNNSPGPRFNKKMSSYQYRKSHCGDKTVVRSSYLHNGISYTGKMTSLYWIGALLFIIGTGELLIN